eukprot:2769344-Prymnesium_polylepis.1
MGVPKDLKIFLNGILLYGATRPSLTCQFTMHLGCAPWVMRFVCAEIAPEFGSIMIQKCDVPWRALTLFRVT